MSGRRLAVAMLIVFAVALVVGLLTPTVPEKVLDMVGMAMVVSSITLERTGKRKTAPPNVGMPVEKS